MNLEQTHIRKWFLYPVLGGLSLARRVLLAALALATIGVLWDGAWHLTFGRDRFFSPPHLFIYSGVTLTVLTAARLIAVSTWRPGSRGHLSGKMRRLGRFAAPPGVFIVLAGALTILFAAPFDEWWHQTFGIDTTVWSPPHMVGFFGGSIVSLGILTFVRNAGSGISARLRLKDGRLWAIAFILGCWSLMIGAMAMGPFVTYHEIRFDPSFYPIALSLATVVAATFALRVTGRSGVVASTVLIMWAIHIGVGSALTSIGYTRVVSIPPMTLVTAFTLDLAFTRLRNRRLWPVVAGVLTPITLFPVEAMWAQLLTGQTWPLFDTLTALVQALPISLVGAMAGEWLAQQVAIQTATNRD